MLLPSLALLALIGGSTALVTHNGGRAPNIFHGMSSEDSSGDEEVVKVVEADVVGDRETNSQSPTHALTQTSSKMRDAEGVDDAEEVADSIEESTQSSDAKTATSIGTSAEDEEVVKVVEADVVQEGKGKEKADTKENFAAVASKEDDGMIKPEMKDDENDDDDDETEDESRDEEDSAKPHPSVMQVGAPKIKIASVKPTAKKIKSAVRAVAPQKQFHVASALTKKNLRSTDGKAEVKMVSEATASPPSRNPEPASQQASKEAAASPQSQAAAAPIRADCDEGSEFNNNDC